MKRLLISIAAAAVVGLPLAAQAQSRQNDQGYRYDRVVGSASVQGRDASARVGERRAWRGGDARYGAADRRGFDTRPFADRGVGDRRDRMEARVEIAPGFGGYTYGGYDDAGLAPYDGYGGYYGYGAYPAGGYGADYAYAYPNAYGTYQPFDYRYAAGDDAYYADGDAYQEAPYAAAGAPYPQAPPYVAEGAPYDDGGGYAARPDEGWSAGAPPADCGAWVWREGRGAYDWVPAPCGHPGE